MKFAIAVVVKFEGEVGFLAGADHALKPFLKGGIFRGEFRIGRLIPIAIKILAAHVEASAAKGHAVFISHRKNVNGVSFEEACAFRLKKMLDEAFDDPIAAGFPGVGPSSEENAIRGVGFADANDFQFTSQRSFADGRDLDKRIDANGIKETVEIGEAVRLDARNVKSRARHHDVELDALGGKGFSGNRFPGMSILGDDHRFKFACDRARGGVPDIVEVQEFKRDVGSWISFDTEMDVTGGAVRGIAFEIVEEMDLNDVVGGEVIPDRRTVLDRRIDEMKWVRKSRDDRQLKNGKNDADAFKSHGNQTNFRISFRRFLRRITLGG